MNEMKKITIGTLMFLSLGCGLFAKPAVNGKKPAHEKPDVVSVKHDERKHEAEKPAPDNKKNDFHKDDKPGKIAEGKKHEGDKKPAPSKEDKKHDVDFRDHEHGKDVGKKPEDHGTVTVKIQPAIDTKDAVELLAVSVIDSIFDAAL